MVALANSYRMMADIQRIEYERARVANESLPIINMTFRRDRRTDLRRFNEPTANEVAMVFVDDNGEPPFERDIRIYPVNPVNPNQQYINLNILSANCDPIVSPLLFHVDPHTFI